MPIKQLIRGVGTNDASYPVHEREYLGIIDGKRRYRTIWQCPYYKVWNSILERGYSQRLKDKFPTYQDVTVCPEWHLFSNFRAWMEKQDWEGKQIDKDLLIPGNKEYSPEACRFVSGRVNTFVLDCNGTRNDLPLGVHFNMFHGKYKAQVSTPAGRKHLGYFDCPLAAGRAWLEAKRGELVSLIADEQLDAALVAGLKARYAIMEEELYGN